MSAALSRSTTSRSIRTLLAALLAAGLAGAACAPASNPPTLAVSREGNLVVQVVDSVYDAGRGNAIALAKDGTPIVSYLLYNPTLKAGDIPPPVLTGRPHPPAVVTATLAKGVWNLTPVPPQSPVGATVGLNPEIADKDGLAVPGVNTSVAVDGDGHQFVVWATPSGLFSADDAGGSFPAEPEKIADGAVVGASIAVAGDGVPWVSWYGGGVVNVARRDVGGRWTSETVEVSSLSGTTARTTSIATGPNDQPVVAYGNGDATVVATRNGASWSRETVSGPGGYAVSLALGSDGQPHVAYYDAQGGVHEAHRSGGSWQASDLDTTSATAEAMASWGTGIGLDGQGVHDVVYADSQSGFVKLATDAGGSFESHVVPGTISGAVPSLAVTSAGKVYVAFFSALDADLTVAVPATGSLTLAHPLPTNHQPSVPPQPSGSSTAPPPCSPSGTTLQISAQNIAFDTNCLAAPADTAFTIDFNNKEPVPHNVEIFDQQGGSRLGGATGPSDILTGPASATYDVPALKAGIYYFQCDIHPTQMFGTFVVASAK